MTSATFSPASWIWRVRDMNVGPHLGSPLGEVTRGLENTLGSHRRLVDYVHVRHDADPKLLTAGAVSVA